jgi:hypothetical protein
MKPIFPKTVSNQTSLLQGCPFPKLGPSEYTTGRKLQVISARLFSAVLAITAIDFLEPGGIDVSA